MNWGSWYKGGRRMGGEMVVIGVIEDVIRGVIIGVMMIIRTSSIVNIPSIIRMSRPSSRSSSKVYSNARSTPKTVTPTP